MERRADPRIAVIPDIHGHAKGEHKAFAEERPIPYTARMLFLWFFHACRRSSPRFLMVADHMNYLTFEDPAAVNLVRRALKLAQAGDLYGAAETAGVELGHAAVVSEGLRRGMRYSIGAEIDNDPRCRPDAQNIVDAMKPDGMIRSIHFLPITHPQHGDNWMWAFDNPEFKDLYDIVGAATVWEIYMTTLLDAIDKLPGNIVGHFYVPAKFGHWPEDRVLEDYEDRFVAACAERGMAIEVNSRYFYKYYAGDDESIARYRSAHLRLLGKAKAANVMIAVGSDAHSPKDQGNAFDIVLALLDESDINEIAFPIAGRLARVALRATDEVIKAHAAALAAPVAARPAPKTNATIAVETDDDDAEDVEPEAAVVAAIPAAAPAVVASAGATASPARPNRSRAKPKAASETDTSVAVAASHMKPEPPADPPADSTAAAPAVAPKKRSHKKGGGVAALLAQASETVAAVAAAAVEFVAEVVSSKPAVPNVDAPAADEPAHQRETATPTEKDVLAPATVVAAHAPASPAKRTEISKPEKPQPGRRSAPPEPPAPPARPVSVRASKSTPQPQKSKTASKSAPSKAMAKPVTHKPDAKSPVKEAAKKAPATKPTRPSASAKKTQKSTASSNRSVARPSAAKKSAAKKSAAKPMARSVAKKAPAKRAPAAKKAIAKVPKRSVPSKSIAKKKSAPKKPIAKKKTARARR